MKLIKNLTIIAIATAVTYGCSSSSDGGSTTLSPNGIYSGTITGGDSSRNGVEEKGISYNGRLMVLSRKADGIDQLFNTNLSISDTSLTGSGERYSVGSRLNLVAYSGSFVDKTSATIGFTQSDSSVNTLPSGSMNLTSNTILYSKGSATNILADTWSGGFGTGFVGQMSLTIDSSGNITNGLDTAASTCTFTGSITSADSTLNVYNATLTSSGGNTCTMPAGDYTGLAWTEGDTNGTLVLMVSDGNRGRAVILTRN